MSRFHPVRLLVIFFLLVLLQFSFFSLSANALFRPDLLLLLLCYSAFHTDIKNAVFAGFFLGMVQSWFSFLPSLAYGLTYGLIGLVLGMLSKGVLREMSVTRFLFALIGLCIKWLHISCLAFFLYKMNWFSALTVLKGRMLPEIAASLIVAPFLFTFFDKILMKKRRYHFAG